MVSGFVFRHIQIQSPEPFTPPFFRKPLRFLNCLYEAPKRARPPLEQPYRSSVMCFGVFFVETNFVKIQTVASFSPFFHLVALRAFPGPKFRSLTTLKFISTRLHIDSFEIDFPLIVSPPSVYEAQFCLSVEVVWELQFPTIIFIHGSQEVLVFPAVMSAGSIGQVVNSRGPFDTGTAERPRSESTENHFLSEAFRPSAESADLSNGLLQSSK